MNVLAKIVVVSATILSAVRLARCQADQVDSKYLDPNDYFLAGGDQQDRRRILQDAFNRYVPYSFILLFYNQRDTKYIILYLLLVYHVLLNFLKKNNHYKRKCSVTSMYLIICTFKYIL